MQLRVSAGFAEPGDYPITITLTGSLSGFSKLRDALRESDIPHYEVDDLVYKLDEVFRQLHRNVDASEPAPRRMVEGDL